MQPSFSSILKYINTHKNMRMHSLEKNVNKKINPVCPLIAMMISSMYRLCIFLSLNICWHTQTPINTDTHPETYAHPQTHTHTSISHNCQTHEHTHWHPYQPSHFPSYTLTLQIQTHVTFIWHTNTQHACTHDYAWGLGLHINCFCLYHLILYYRHFPITLFF